MTLRFILEPTLDHELVDTFDQFMASGSHASYQQSRSWAGAAPVKNRQEWRYFACFDDRAGGDGEVVGAAVVRLTRLALGYRLATVQRGPVVHAPEHLGEVLATLSVALTRARCCSVQLGPRVRGRALPTMAEAMRAAGFVPLPADRQPLHSTTGIVWLDKPEAEILAGFKQRARRQIRAATKGDVVVRAVNAADSDDLAQFQAVLDAFGVAHPGYDMGGLADAAGQAALIAALGGGMLLATCEGRPIGAHAFVRQGDEAIWLSLATLNQSNNPSAGAALLWEAMRMARAQGAVGYDLAGMTRDPARDSGEAGRHQFKTGFAPSMRTMPAMHVKALRTLPHALLFGARQAYRSRRARSEAPKVDRGPVPEKAHG